MIMKPNITIQDLADRLQGPHRKLTPQRRTILQMFIDNAGEHFSAEDIHYRLHKQNCEIG